MAKRIFGRHVARQAVLGFLFGYCVLHPISMVVFRWLGSHGLTDSPGNRFLEPILPSFRPDMIPTKVIFGRVSKLIALVLGDPRCVCT